MPLGIAGLIVAGVFAAAQSTVSTSMNSTATAFVTDFLRPFSVCQTEKMYLSIARWSTFFIGVLGTLLGLIFVDPQIKSLFDASIKIIGLFMGLLGGLFILGATPGYCIRGVSCRTCWSHCDVFLWQFTTVNGYLYSAVCLRVGWFLVSTVTGPQEKDLCGLTIYTLAEVNRQSS